MSKTSTCRNKRNCRNNHDRKSPPYFLGSRQNDKVGFICCLKELQRVCWAHSHSAVLATVDVFLSAIQVRGLLLSLTQLEPLGAYLSDHRLSSVQNPSFLLKDKSSGGFAFWDL